MKKKLNVVLLAKCFKQNSFKRLDGTNLAKFGRFVHPQCSLYHPVPILAQLCSQLAIRLEPVISASARCFWVKCASNCQCGRTCMLRSYALSLDKDF